MNQDLIARCEREAAAGKKPELEDSWYVDYSDHGTYVRGSAGPASVEIQCENINLDLLGENALGLYAESLLREAAAPLFAAEIAKLTSDVEHLGAVLRRLVRDGLVTVAQVDHASAEIIGEEVDAMTPEQISAEVKASGIDIDRLMDRTRALMDAAKKKDSNHAD